MAERGVEEPRGAHGEICSRRVQGVPSGEDSSRIEFSNYASRSHRYGVVVGCALQNEHESRIVGDCRLAPYLPAPKPENARITEDVPSDSFIRRESNAHLLLEHVGFTARRGLPRLRFSNIVITEIEINYRD
ncbi:hypothetical protein ALC56_00757 [Trachymyrmex septentrionalis]|uniref:Uncharacterized protein n=1 Tax=Trachymyrmex septentrionalis TaxID=34720 RepID=A0A195FWR7_9HYME|nr:hypothetical protein ALC56_00757 [Trachymyrmex septentrionalis]